MSPDSLLYEKDVETTTTALVQDDSVSSFSWSGINVKVKDRTTKQPITILESCSGIAKAGEVVALMGPSGSGKTTLLNALANRLRSSWDGRICVNDHLLKPGQLRDISGYVEQDDALIGSLTVRETIDFSYKLAIPHLKKKDRREMTDALLAAFGLKEQEQSLIGTPLRRGISGGQKRRVSVAAQLVTSPKILFLDEPTSGLDSAASYEVMKFISSVAKKHNLIVIASIHQPSTTTFELFDSLLLLSKGKTCYFGPVKAVPSFFNGFVNFPARMNPAEFLLDLVNTDFNPGRTPATLQGPRPEISEVYNYWNISPTCQELLRAVGKAAPSDEFDSQAVMPYVARPSHISTSFFLLQRNFIKSYRDFLAYGTRVAMYIGLAIMMGTVWLRLPYSQSSIQPFINAIFFSGAFMSFMAVAYVPSIIEDLALFKKEHANGLVGPFSFTIANFLVGAPYLLIITLLFSVITYWLCNFWHTAEGFWMSVLWLWLDLLAAEGLVVLISAIFPIFVVSLAATAFANGLWMSVGGFLVPLGTLNVFWKYVFHYIDYQAYVFQAMMVNQFKQTTYTCDRLAGGYHCLYASDLQVQGKVPGTAVLDFYQYSHETGKMWQWFGIMVSIIVVYRILGYGVLLMKTRRL